MFIRLHAFFYFSNTKSAQHEVLLFRQLLKQASQLIILVGNI